MAFFIYRAISPNGADNLVYRIKQIPVSLWLVEADPIATWTTFTSSLFAAWVPALDAFFWPPIDKGLTGDVFVEVDEPTVISEIPVDTSHVSVVTETTLSPSPSSSSSSDLQSPAPQLSYVSDIEFLNALFK